MEISGKPSEHSWAPELIGDGSCVPSVASEQARALSEFFQKTKAERSINELTESLESSSSGVAILKICFFSSFSIIIQNLFVYLHRLLS